MADEGVNIPFSANVTGAIAGIKQLQEQLKALGLTAEQTNRVISRLSINKVLYPPGTNSGTKSTSGGGGSTSPTGEAIKEQEALSNSTLRVIDRLARFLTAIGTVKNALNLMYGEASAAARGFEALGEGARIFANLGQIWSGTFGKLAAGAVGAASAALFFFTETMKANIEATENMTEAQIKANEQTSIYSRSLDALNKSGAVFNDTFGKKMADTYSLNRSYLENAPALIAKLRSELEKAQHEYEKLIDPRMSAATIGRAALSFFAGNPNFGEGLETGPSADNPQVKAALAVIQSLKREIENVDKTIAAIVGKASLLDYAKQMGVFSDKVRAVTDEINAFYRSPGLDVFIGETKQKNALFGQNFVEEGQIKAAQTLLGLREQSLRLLIQERDATQSLLYKAEAQLSRNPADAEVIKLISTLKAMLDLSENGIKAATDQLENAQKDLNKALAPGLFTQRFTIPFTQAIGDAVINGIVQGKKGMEILADLSKNLLNAALQDVFKNFQQGMIDAFKAIAGAGGELLGSALITVVGVVAGILGRRASSTNTFDKIKSQIESTEAVRGIVAGPTNVAIAAVGDNLRRALVGVEQRLDVLIQVTLQVRDRIGGVPFAGSVAA